MTSNRPPESSVPLAHFRETSPADVELSCTSCQLMRVLPLESVIARLIARGFGDERTGIKAVARFVEVPCSRCGGRSFETRPHFRGREIGPDRVSDPVEF